MSQQVPVNPHRDGRQQSLCAFGIHRATPSIHYFEDGRAKFAANFPPGMPVMSQEVGQFVSQRQPLLVLRVFSIKKDISPSMPGQQETMQTAVNPTAGTAESMPMKPVSYVP
jgi:hypothetical protein